MYPPSKFVNKITTKIRIFSISGDTVYIIEFITNQSPQTGIDSICKPSDPNMFLINRTVPSLHTNNAPKTPATNIGFGLQCHTPVTTTVYPASHLEQCLRRQFHPAITGHQHIGENTTANRNILAENICDLLKIIPLLCNLTLKYDTLIALIFLMIKLLWTSQLPWINHALLFRTSDIFKPPSKFFTLWSLLW